MGFVFLSHFLSFFEGDFSFIFEIRFVANDTEDDRILGIVLEVFDPDFQILKAFSIFDGID